MKFLSLFESRYPTDDFDQLDPKYKPYGFWIWRDGSFLEVDDFQGHLAVAQELGYELDGIEPPEYHNDESDTHYLQNLYHGHDACRAVVEGDTLWHSYANRKQLKALKDIAIVLELTLERD